MPLAALLLLAATPFVTEEVAWRTVSPAVTFRPAPQAARIAADGDGYVVAWAEVEDGISRGYAGRLDAAGRLSTIGVKTIGVAGTPSIAPFGDRYIAAWLEPGVVVAGALDRDFKLIAARPIGISVTPPVVRTTATRAWIGAGVILYEVDREGAPLALFNVPLPIDDVAAAGDDVGYVFHESTLSLSIQVPRPTPRYNLGFTWLYRLTAGMSLRFDSRAPAAVAPGTSMFLVVWAESAPRMAIKGALFGTSDVFVISENGQRRFDAQTQPQVAWDGERWVVVWDSSLGIEGAVITPDRIVTPFKISASGWRPAIAASKPGRFLVTYEVESLGRKLASRLIGFGPPNQRGRAVR